MYLQCMEFLHELLHYLGFSVVVLAIFAGLAAVFMCWVLPFFSYLKLRKNGFSGPSPSFPLGNLREMAASSSSNRQPLGLSHNIHSHVFPYFAHWRSKYGKVFTYWLGTEPFLYIGEPEFLKEVASEVASKTWGKPNVFKHDRWPLFGKGLIMTEGDEWHSHRHIIAPAFSSANLKAMTSMMVETTTKMLDQWRNLVEAKKQEIDIESYITENAAEIIAKTSFGIDDKQGQEVYEKLKFMQLLLFNSSRLVGVPFNRFMYPLKTHQIVKLGKEIDELLFSIITSRKANITCARQNDLLSLLIAGKSAGDNVGRVLTERELVDECKTFFFGGHETTALALSWTLLLLALNQDWQCKLRDEIADVTKGEPLKFDMLAKMEKMEWTFKEVIRLYSPAPNVQRQARQEIHAGGLTIPKGTNIWIDVVAMHHDPQLWGNDVNEFNPERFKKSPFGGCTHRMGYLPFGFGGRLCIGRNLSMMEYKVVLSLIVSRFSMAVSPSYSHSPTILLSLRPKNGINLVLHPL